MCLGIPQDPWLCLLLPCRVWQQPGLVQWSEGQAHSVAHHTDQDRGCSSSHIPGTHAPTTMSYPQSLPTLRPFPKVLTSVATFWLAPFSSKNLTTSKWFSCAAMYKGVKPFCKPREKLIKIHPQYWEMLKQVQNPLHSSTGLSLSYFHSAHRAIPPTHISSYKNSLPLWNGLVGLL